MGRPLKTSDNNGQALLLAVLIMMAILLTGTLFVAVVNYSQRTSSRESELVKAQGLAEAGIRYANYMLQFSAEGLDWRPPNPPREYTKGSPDSGFYDYYSDQETAHKWSPLVDVGPDDAPGGGDDYFRRFGFTRYPNILSGSEDSLDIQGGHFLLRVTYDPDPPYEKDDAKSPKPLSQHIRIESVGVVDAGGFVFRRLEAYKPVVLTDYLLFVTDRSARGYPTILGFQPNMDMDKDGSLGVGDFFSPEFAGSISTYTYNGPMRFNTDVQFIGANATDTADPAQASNKILLVDGPIDPITGQPYSIPLWGGYLRDDYFELHGQVSDEEQSSTGNKCAAFDVVTATSASLEDLNSDRIREDVARLTPPELFAKDPATGTMRWYALTRDGGVVVTPAAGPYNGRSVNVAQLGYMWDENMVGGYYPQIAGLYIDNSEDIQFGGRTSQLMQDWLHNLPGNAPDTGWNATGEVYDQAPAVEIELFPTEAATLLDPYDSTGDATPQAYEPVTDPSPAAALDDLYDTDGKEIWWPNHVYDSENPGEPGIRITRGEWSIDDTGAIDHDDGGEGGGEWLFGDPVDFDNVGTPFGRTMYVDYPEDYHAVIFAEGNIRIKGRLPRRNVNSNNDRMYHLTVVSGGTIYIDGQILSPQDQYGRDYDGDQQAGATSPVTDEYNTYIALLARDCVVVNPTMLVPQFTDKQGDVTAQNDPDDSLGMHWQMPYSPIDTQNYTQSQFYFGASPVGSVHLTAYQGLEGEGGATSTTLAVDATVGLDLITVTEDLTSTWVPMAHQLLIIDRDDPSQQYVYNFTEILGTTIRLAPNAVHPYPAGSEVINLTLGKPAVTGISLKAYEETGGWRDYDFDPGGSGENIFVLTRKYLGTHSDPPWVWEGGSLWAPLQDTYWPWLLDTYIDPTAGMINQLSFVMPIKTDIEAANGNGEAEEYLLKRFKLLEYDGGGQVTGTIHAKINAVMYAEQGCFFVIPCRYFRISSDAWWESEKYLRYNYDIEIRGAITENFHPGPAAVREWQEKWAYPEGSVGTDWNSIRYIYDETLRAARLQAPTVLGGIDNNIRSSDAIYGSRPARLVKLPLLPATPDLLYYGEAP